MHAAILFSGMSIATDSLLLYRPVRRVKIDGRQYRVNTDFRVFVRFELLMQDHSLSDVQRLETVLRAFYPAGVPDNREAAADKLLELYTRGRETDHAKSEPTSGDRMIYSYAHDGGRIYASFRQCYGICLTAVKLDWREFRALLDNLPDDCEFMKAVTYRAMKIDGKLPPEERERLRRLKKFYALPDNRTAEEKERDFAATIAALF